MLPEIVTCCTSGSAGMTPNRKQTGGAGSCPVFSTAGAGCARWRAVRRSATISGSEFPCRGNAK